MPPATIRSLAAATGLSKTTVSLALRNSLLVAAATREQVHRAAQKAGYRPNPMVSALMGLQRRGRGAANNPTIGLVELYPSASEGTIIHLNRGWQATRRATDETGYHLDRFSIHTPRAMPPARLQQIIRHRGIRGIILVHGGDLPPEWQLDWSEFCVVELASPHPIYHSVKTDFVASGRMVIAELVRRGYRRIAWYVAPSVEGYSGNRWQFAFHEHNRRLPAAARVAPMIDARYNRESFLTWLDRHRPEAIVTNGTTELEWLRQAGRRVPEDVGYASVSVLPRDLGKVAGLDALYDVRMMEAVHLLDGLLRRNQTGRPDPPMILNVPSRWVDGPTVRPAPGG